MLNLTAPLEIGLDYQVTVRDDLLDCNGNEIGLSNEAIIAVPEPIEEQDIIINEVLFNPETGGSDFLELYNKTNKTIDLSTLVLRNAIIYEDQLGNDSLDGSAVAITREFLISP